jgi:glycosyltransferase involved in cell wall biosynthesis
MNITLIAKRGHENSGVGRYTVELARALEKLGHRVSVTHPNLPLPHWLIRAVQRWLGWDLEAFFNNYPLWTAYPAGDIYHFTSQNLASLLLLRRPPGKTVVTVHDIIPWLTRHDPELRAYDHSMEAFFDWLALRGLRRADDIVTVSIYTWITLGQVAGPSTSLEPTVQRRLK